MRIDNLLSSKIVGLRKSSILFFTMHRSGSMFIHELCDEISSLSGLDHFSPNHGNLDPKEEHQWKKHNCCYAPLRFFPKNLDSVDLSKYNIILHLRDPRDVLTSMFYSYCYYHPGDIKPGQRIRNKVAKEGIDKFVLTIAIEKEMSSIEKYGTGDASSILTRYHEYVDKILDLPNCTFVKYQEMVTAFPNWLEKVLPAFDLDDEKMIKRKMVKKYGSSFKVEIESPSNHKRKVMPHDYRSKLKKETILELNSIFLPILNKLNFSVN